ncbi:MAG: PrgI family protein [Candidatus Peregrinibacteria bacterium]|nr:PrgI family protein [Candidatus Peregrinibacteria bacterium]MDZ4245341.1 PrgI family protein [Candidatus Gracilibacteria bacterium]
MQFKIPQNVQIEDKIVGPLTFRQLIVLGVGGGIAYLIYLQLASVYFWKIWLPPVAIVSLITLAFAFVRPLGVSFVKYTFLLAEFWLKPRKRMWVKGQGDIYISAFTNMKAKPSKVAKKANKKHSHDQTRLNDLDELTSILDSRDTRTQVLSGRN